VTLEELKNKFAQQQGEVGANVKFGNTWEPFATITFQGTVEVIDDSKRFIDICRAVGLIEWMESVER